MYSIPRYGRLIVFLLALFAVLAFSVPAEAQLATFFRFVRVGDLDGYENQNTELRAGIYIVTDPLDESDCDPIAGGGGSADPHICFWDGTQWVPVSGSGGSSTVLDIDDDGADESTGITEIASIDDTIGILTEPAADKALFDFGNLCLSNGVNCPLQTSIGSYDPDYEPSSGVLMNDEFDANLPQLTWASQNLDSATITYSQDSLVISRAGTTDAWHGLTEAPPPDTGEDWWLVAKVWVSQDTDAAFGATEGCGISIGTGGSESTPTEINSIYFRYTSTTAAAIEHLDHDDFDFAGTTSIETDTLAATTPEGLLWQHATPIYLGLKWTDSSEDIEARWSGNGRAWASTGTDTTVDGYPQWVGMFARDNQACMFEWVRVLDQTIDDEETSGTFGTLNVGGREFSGIVTPVFHGVSVTQDGDSASLASGDEVPWDAEDFDTDHFHSNATDTTKIVIPDGLEGYYSCSYGVTTASATTGDRTRFAIIKNDGTDLYAVQNATDAESESNLARASGSATLYLAAGDYVELTVEGDASVAIEDGLNESHFSCSQTARGTIFDEGQLVEGDSFVVVTDPPSSGATRFYISSTQAADVTPSQSISASWNNSAGLNAKLVVNGEGSTLTTSGTTSWGSDPNSENERLHYRLVSDPMAAGVQFTTSTTITGYGMVREFGSTDNIYAITTHAYIISEDGATTRGEILAWGSYGSPGAGVTEFNNTALQVQQIANNDTLTGAVTTVTGDRILIDFGYQCCTGGSGVSPQAAVRLGENGSDCPQNETSTSDCALWIEFSNHITFLSEPGDVSIYADATKTASFQASRTKVFNRFVFEAQAATCTDNGGGTAQTLTLTPTTSYVEITNDDANGCTLTMGETGAVESQEVEIIVISNAGGTVDFADTSGVSELSSAYNAGVFDSIKMRYTGDRWVEIARSPDDDDPESINLEASNMATNIADDEVPVGASANNLVYTAVPDCDAGKLLYDTSTNTFSCGTDAVGVGGGGAGEYNPDNYPPTGDTLTSDEFTSGATLTWTQQNADSQAVSYTMGGVILDAAGTTDAWHGITTPVPADSGQDWYLVAKVRLVQPSAGTQGCGISLINGGTAASPTEINTAYARWTLSTSAAMESLDHDDYDFAGTTSIQTTSISASAQDTAIWSTHSFYLFLLWIDATEDIAAGWSMDGVVWNGLGNDTTVDGYPVAMGLFSRDNEGCFIDFVRILDTDVDSVGVPAGTYVRIGS